MPVPTDIKAMIRTKQIVNRVLMSTREISLIIRGALSAGDETSLGFFRSSIAKPTEMSFPTTHPNDKRAAHKAMIWSRYAGLGCFGWAFRETGNVLEFLLQLSRGFGSAILPR